MVAEAANNKWLLRCLSTCCRPVTQTLKACDNLEVSSILDLRIAAMLHALMAFALNANIGACKSMHNFLSDVL